ncbi:MAG: NAD-dependent epimerase/dehydratase family protein, partial [Gammaproteobacteria bacterium]
LKSSRLQQLGMHAGFRFEHLDIIQAAALSALIAREQPERIVHLAAQAGVRYSLKNPQAYVDANITGFLNLLEATRHHGCDHLVYASTSSVYGSNAQLPLATGHNVDHPVSLYAATKKANELMAHAYSHLYGLPCTGLRFFTVYGPWGRPDMAFFTFTRKMLAGEPIDIYNHGQLSRDFTYVEDIADGIVRVLDRPATPDPAYDRANPSPARSNVPWRIYNIGSNRRAPLLQYISVLEQALGVNAIRNNMPMQAGDVEDTFADVSDLAADVDFQPRTPIEIGIPRFVSWYLDYYHPSINRPPNVPGIAS